MSSGLLSRARFISWSSRPFSCSDTRHTSRQQPTDWKQRKTKERMTEQRCWKHFWINESGTYCIYNGTQHFCQWMSWSIYVLIHTYVCWVFTDIKWMIRMGRKLHRGVLYLTESYGIVVGLGSCVEVDGLFDIIMALIVSGQVVWRRPVSCVVGYFRCLV